MADRYWWSKPKQVSFVEEVDEGEFVHHAGIAYRDEIICGCCGSIVDPEDCAEIIELPWANLEEEEIGGLTSPKKYVIISSSKERK